jgi:cysteine-rich repeat protein
MGSSPPDESFRPMLFRDLQRLFLAAAWVLAACSSPGPAGEDAPVDDDGTDGEGETRVCGNGEVEAGEQCDDGNDVEGDGCDGDCRYSCHGDYNCSDGHDCTEDLCDAETHACVFVLRDRTVVCRAADGVCDIEEACDGVNEDCPADEAAPPGTPCDDGEACTYPDACDGRGSCVGGPGALEGAVSVTAGLHHTCALLETGRVQCWGEGVGGLHAGEEPAPVDIEGLPSGMDGVSAGTFFTCALSGEGAATCWGFNLFGQIGDGTNEYREFPTAVAGLSSGVVAVDAGFDHACALLSSGSVMCWGENRVGQVGDGTTEQRNAPVEVLDLSNAVAVSAGADHTCAVLDTGGLKCWGGNGYGELGIEGFANQPVPVDVPGLESGVVAVSAGVMHSCALLDTGGLRCWGANDSGQVGDGTESARSAPVDVAGLSSGVAAVSAGSGSVCAVLETGQVRCWGENYDGQLGHDSSLFESPLPVDVRDLPAGAVSVSVNWGQACAVLDTGEIACWGNNEYGQLGLGWPEQRTVPTRIPGFTSEASAISAGGYHTCAVSNAGGAWCWGADFDGQTGMGIPSTRQPPMRVIGLSSGVAGICSGEDFACALLEDASVSCWGYNEDGQLGNGTTDMGVSPVGVSGLSSGATAVSCGSFHACAVLETGGVRCWGWNDYGQLGDGTLEDRLAPVDVAGLASGVEAVGAGHRHTCALLAAGEIRCWGGNSRGQLGDGTTVDRLAPVPVEGLSSRAVSVAAGDAYTCALLDTGGVQCWGINISYLLGDGTTEMRTTPVDVLGLETGVITLSSGGSHWCAVLASGGVRCWGSNEEGQLGNGTPSYMRGPADVIGLTGGIRALSAGSAHTCAMTDEGEVLCWGRDDYGQSSGSYPGYPHLVACR